MSKQSIRFYKDHEVRAIWDEEQSKWWFSVLDVVGAINEQEDYQKNRNYWKYLKAKLKKEVNEVVSGTNQLKLTAPDDKKYNIDITNKRSDDKIIASCSVLPSVHSKCRLGESLGCGVRGSCPSRHTSWQWR